MYVFLLCVAGWSLRGQPCLIMTPARENYKDWQRGVRSVFRGVSPHLYLCLCAPCVCVPCVPCVCRVCVGVPCKCVCV